MWVWVKVGGLRNLIVIIFQKEEKVEGVCCTGVYLFKLSVCMRVCVCGARVCVYVCMLLYETAVFERDRSKPFL